MFVSFFFYLSRLIILYLLLANKDSHCRVLPSSEDNGVILELLSVGSDSLLTPALTVSP